MAQEPWHLSGEYFEACNCDLICPCLVQAPPSRGRCDAALAFHIADGTYGQTILNDRTTVLVVSYQDVFGTLEVVQQVLAACGWQSNTAFVERLNLSLRQHVAAIGRRVSRLCQDEDGFGQQLALYHVYDNFVLPHASVCQLVPQSGPTPGTGSATQ